MNFRDYYYLGEVILGLRIEYRRINQELEALKEDVSVDVSRLSNFYFRIVELENKKAKLECFFREKAGLVTRFFKRFALELGVLFRSGKFSECLKNQYNSFEIHPSWFSFKIVNQESFDEKADKIMTSKFTRNMKMREKEIPNVDGTLDIEHSGIRFAKWDEDTEGLLFLDYQSHEDALFFGSFSEDLETDSLKSILMTPIRKNSLHPFHQELIEENTFDKDIVVDDGVSDTTFAKLDILEDEDKIVLKRSK